MTLISRGSSCTLSIGDRERDEFARRLKATMANKEGLKEEVIKQVEGLKDQLIELYVAS